MYTLLLILQMLAANYEKSGVLSTLQTRFGWQQINLKKKSFCAEAWTDGSKWHILDTQIFF